MEGAFLLSLTKTMPKTNTIEIAFKYLLLSIEKLDQNRTVISVCQHEDAVDIWVCRIVQHCEDKQSFGFCVECFGTRNCHWKLLNEQFYFQLFIFKKKRKDLYIFPL